MGLRPAEIGAFVGSLYLPWAFKWVLGPVVDTISSDRLGRRRAWIVSAQLGMILTLLVALPIDLTTDVKRWWQGRAIEKFGYPTTLLLDGVIGLAPLLLLPLMPPVPLPGGSPASGRRWGGRPTRAPAASSRCGRSRSPGSPSNG